MAEQIYNIKGALDSGSEFTEDAELEAIKARVMEMEEEEEEKLREAQYCSDKLFPYGSLQTGLFYSMTPEERIDADTRSVYVGNVDYGTTADELEIYFNGCGHVNRVTILCDKFTGHPKGFAYIEFSDRESVRMAMALDETLFRGRVIKEGKCRRDPCSLNHYAIGYMVSQRDAQDGPQVCPKRTNMPGISSTDRGFMRGGRFRGRGIRASRFHNGFQGRFRSFMRGSGRAQPWYISY